MKTVLSSTALVLALAAPAFAEQHSGMFVTAPEENALRASELVGARLYVSENDIADDQMGIDENWDDVGEISEIVMGQDGQVDFIVADIGGFLGLGEKPVAVSLDQLQFVSDGAEADDWFVVLKAAQADLENAPEFEGWDMDAAANEAGETMEQAAEDTAAAAGDAAEATGDAAADAADAAVETAENATEQAAETMEETAESAAGAAENMAEGNYVDVTAADLTTEDMTGARVYDANGEWIGEVGLLVMTDDGNAIEEAVVDVGGFLGLGEKPVALPIEELKLQREGEGGALRATVAMTKDELEALPRYEG